MMEGKNNPFRGLSSAIGEYLSMRTDELRQGVITGLSAGFSRVLAVLIITLLLVVVLIVFAFAFIIMLGDCIDSYSSAAFIVAGVYLVGVLILFFLRVNAQKRVFFLARRGYAEHQSLAAISDEVSDYRIYKKRGTHKIILRYNSL